MTIINLLADCNNINAHTAISIHIGYSGKCIWEGEMLEVPGKFKDCKVDTFTVLKTGVKIYL